MNTRQKESIMETPEAIRQRLEARLVALTQRLTKVEHDRRRATNPLEPDWEEQAITRQNDQVLDVLEAEGSQEVAAIRAALQRLDNGSYRLCVSCGEPIAPARLQALPYAVQCIVCAAQAERTGRPGH
jgi:RNA polymerase-binding transcription factor DksA